MQGDGDPHFGVEGKFVGSKTKKAVDPGGCFFQATKALFCREAFARTLHVTEVKRNGSNCCFHGLLRETARRNPSGRRAFPTRALSLAPSG
jgi:hypothetical protein